MTEDNIPYRLRLAAIRNGLAEKTTKAKEKKPIAKQSEKKKAEIKAIKEAGKPASKLELDVWFADKIETHFGPFFGYCWECGDKIPRQFARAAVAHLLPKKNFKSVATHPENYMILGAHCCHKKTDRLDLFVKMRMWNEAARRIKVMMPLLPHDELKYISSQLLAELDKVK